jgi:ABC-type nitrate/sulfonate/bicarbonate transport system substrate-binding protein
MRRLIGAASIIVSAAATALIGGHDQVRAQTLQPVSVIVFPGGFNWPIWIAQEKGFFARGGVEVKLTNTPNSVFQLTGLIEGRFDIAITAIDNPIAYMEGQGEAPVSVEPDLVAFLGSDNGFLSLVTQPDVKTVTDLKGRTVSVDAMTTGYAFVLFDLLERGGLNKGDYEVVRAGGVLSRWEALKEGKHAGTLLTTPFDLLAEAAGYRRLANAPDVLGSYQGLVGATRRSWAAANSTKLVGFVRGFRSGLDWLFDVANKPEAVAILEKNVRGMTADLATRTYDVLLGPDGFTRSAAIDLEGVRTVLALRSQYARPPKALTDPARYVDLTYYERASGSR